MPQRLHRSALIVSLLLGLLIRGWGLDERGLWFDEMLSLQSALGSLRTEPLSPSPDGLFTQAASRAGNTLPNVVRAAVWHDSGNAIFYVVVLHYWTGVFGRGDAAVRALSVVAGVGVLWLAWALAVRLAGTSVGSWTLGLMAIHPLFVRASTEARAYAMATLLTLAATILLATQREGPSRGTLRDLARSLAYGALCGAALLSHYLTATILLAHGAYAALFVRGYRKWTLLLLGWSVAAASLVIWLAGAGGDGLRLMAERNQNYARLAGVPSEGDRYARPATPANVAAGVVQMSAASTGNLLPASGVVRLRETLPLLALPLALLGAGLSALSSVPRESRGLLVVLSVSWPVAAVVLALWHGHVIPFGTSYTNFAAPYLCILLAAGLKSLWNSGRAWARAIVGLYIGIAVLSVSHLGWESNREGGPNMQHEIALTLAASVRSGDVVLFPDWESARLVNCYLPERPPVMQRVSQGTTIRLQRGTTVVREFPVPPLAGACAAGC
ncbi:MAG: glycosyltransferase family 39 protein [Vicinamibacteria bacterium]|nr:glycosyltransferase family 39 protein [Vicinamibacteria bacterium]